MCYCIVVAEFEQSVAEGFLQSGLAVNAQRIRLTELVHLSYERLKPLVDFMLLFLVVVRRTREMLRGDVRLHVAEQIFSQRKRKRIYLAVIFPEK